MSKIVKFFLGVLICLLLPMKVEAALADETFVCGNATYIIRRDGSADMSGAGIYDMNFYSTLNYDGTLAGKTYCLSPGRRAPKNGYVYSCERVINPTDTNPDKATQAFDVAVTKAYQLLIDNGYSGLSNVDRYVGELVFRWLSTNYAAGDAGVTYSGGATFINLFKHQTNGDVMPVWYRGNADVQKARQIYLEASRVGNLILSGQTFEQIVEAGEIWSDQWDIAATINSTSSVPSQNKVTYTIRMTVKGSAPSEIYWDEFSASCENGYQCSITNVNVISDTQADFTVEVNTASGSGSDYGLAINTAYYDVRSSTANMLLLRYADSARQRMLIIGDSTNRIVPNTDNESSPRGSHGGSRHNVYTNGCSCETDANGRYTGNYVYNEYKNGVLQNTITFPITDTNQANQYSCPDASVCTNPPEEEKHICEIVDGQHYCEDGQTCNEDE